MDWFTAADVRELQSVSEGLLRESATLLRVVGSIAGLSIFEPGAGYEVGDILTLEPIAGGVGATLEVTEIEGGSVAEIAIQNPGEGFTLATYVGAGGTGTGAIFRVARLDQPSYEEIASLNCRIFPPGVMKGEYRTLVPAHLRGVPIGAIEVRVADGDNLALGATDRLIVETQGRRLFEVIAPLTARTIEVRRKLIVREIQQPERELYLVYLSGDRDSLSSDAVLPISVVRVLPVPFIIDDPVEMGGVNESGAAEMAVLKRFQVSEVRLDYLDTDSARPDYCVIVFSDVEVTAQKLRDGTFARYRFQDSPRLVVGQWARADEWTLKLVQDK